MYLRALHRVYPLAASRHCLKGGHFNILLVDMKAMAAAGHAPLHLHQLKVAISQAASLRANFVPLIAAGMENFKFPSFAPSFIFNHFFLITAARKFKLL
jgi:hypothetical protein